MNKMIGFPLAFMFMLTIFTMADTGNTFTNQHTNISNEWQMTNAPNQTGTIKVGNNTSSEYNIWGLTGAIVILISALAIGILMGFSVLGSGFSGVSQIMVFTTILFVGLWMILSIVAQEYLLGMIFTQILWVVLTVSYIVGVGDYLSGSGDVG